MKHSFKNTVDNMLRDDLREIRSRFRTYLEVTGKHSSHLSRITAYLLYCQENNINIYNITYDDFEKYIQLCLKTLLKQTVNLHICAIRLLYRFFHNSDKCDCREVISKFKRYKPSLRIMSVNKYLTFEEMRRTLSNALTYHHFHNVHKAKAMLYFIFFTGLRAGEMIRLRRSDFDFEKCSVLVGVPNKTLSERIVFYPSFLVEHLSRYFNSEPEEISAFNINKPKLTDFFISLRKYVPNKKHINARIMRHSFAMFLASQKISERVVQKLLGHSSIDSTLIYYDPDLDMVKDIYTDATKTVNEKEISELSNERSDKNL